MAAFDISSFVSQQDQLKHIGLDMLVPYHKHPFELYTGERLDDMVESIRKNGVLVPAVVRPLNNGKYEILVGHNRWNASKLANKNTIPCIIKEKLSEDEAEMYVIESNLMQRGFDDLRLTEQARVVAMKYSSMFDEQKAEKIRSEIAELEKGKDNVDEEGAIYNGNKNKLVSVGKLYGLSKNSIARLIRINELCDKCSRYEQSLDLKLLSMRAGVELSYISEVALEVIYEYYASASDFLHNNKQIDAINIDMKTAKKIRKMFEGFSGTREQAYDILCEMDNPSSDESKAEEPKDIKVSLDREIFERYFSEDMTKSEISDIVEKALEMYFGKNKS